LGFSSSIRKKTFVPNEPSGSIQIAKALIALTVDQSP
jgi:hypothetical protein